MFGAIITACLDTSQRALAPSDIPHVYFRDIGSDPSSFSDLLGCFQTEGVRLTGLLEAELEHFSEDRMSF